MISIMTDIETLGSTYGSIVFEIGVCTFTDKGVQEKATFLLNYRQAKKDGFRVEQSTVDWWKKQTRDVKPLLLHNTPIQTDLASFAKWVKDRSKANTLFWSKGSFDYPLLEAYFKKYGIPIPWKFWNVRELRTALDTLGYPTSWKGTSHTAEEDAMEQVEKLLQAKGNPMITI